MSTPSRQTQLTPQIDSNRMNINRTMKKKHFGLFSTLLLLICSMLGWGCKDFFFTDLEEKCINSEYQVSPHGAHTRHRSNVKIDDFLMRRWVAHTAFQRRMYGRVFCLILELRSRSKGRRVYRIRTLSCSFYVTYYFPVPLFPAALLSPSFQISRCLAESRLDNMIVYREDLSEMIIW